MAGLGLKIQSPEKLKAAILAQAKSRPDKGSLKLIEQLYGKQFAVDWAMTNIDPSNAVGARSQLDYLNDAWASELDPTRKRAIMDRMTQVSAESDTPNNINGNLSPDQVVDWLKTRQGVKDQLGAMSTTEAEMELLNNQAKAGIAKNAKMGKVSSARSSAARGIANSSIRETALADIDAGAANAKNDLDDRMAMTRAQNDIARSRAINFWNQYDLALDAHRLINASANPPAETPPPPPTGDVKVPPPKGGPKKQAAYTKLVTEAPPKKPKQPRQPKKPGHGGATPPPKKRNLAKAGIGKGKTVSMAKPSLGKGKK